MDIASAFLNRLRASVSLKTPLPRSLVGAKKPYRGVPDVNVLYHSLSRPKDDRKKNANAIEFGELGDVYQIVEHWLRRPKEDETVAAMDEHTGPRRNPKPAFAFVNTC